MSNLKRLVFFPFQRGVCYTLNSGHPNHTKLYVTTSGNIQRLRLLLDAQPEEYYGPYSYDATGFKILVHDQNESYPNIEDFGVDLPPGFTTNIRVRRTKVGLQKLSSSLFETSFSRHLVPVVQKVDSVPGGGVLGLMFVGYLPMASQSPYPIIVYFLANYRAHLLHFLQNVIFAIPT